MWSQNTAGGESRGEQRRLDHARGIGQVLSGDVECRAVVDRGANDREPERDVDGTSECEQLHRNQTLIVIAGDHGIELAAYRAPEYCVSRERTLDIKAALSRRLN